MIFTSKSSFVTFLEYINKKSKYDSIKYVCEHFENFENLENVNLDISDSDLNKLDLAYLYKIIPKMKNLKEIVLSTADSNCHWADSKKLGKAM